MFVFVVDITRCNGFCVKVNQAAAIALCAKRKQTLLVVETIEEHNEIVKILINSSRLNFMKVVMQIIILSNP
jgi:hypothetical protein